jgi:hypothetical protein
VLLLLSKILETLQSGRQEVKIFKMLFICGRMLKIAKSLESKLMLDLVISIFQLYRQQQMLLD